MVDTSQLQKSNSTSDILFHRLKAEQDNKIKQEQDSVNNMKYTIIYRPRTLPERTVPTSRVGQSAAATARRKRKSIRILAKSKASFSMRDDKSSVKHSKINLNSSNNSGNLIDDSISYNSDSIRESYKTYKVMSSLPIRCSKQAAVLQEFNEKFTSLANNSPILTAVDYKHQLHSY